jgi:ABC-2 type transport system permease protein
MSSPAAAVFRRSLRDLRNRIIGFAYLFLAVAYVQPVSYRHAYPTLSDRVAFARSFGNNKAVRLFYGTPHDLLTVGGYSAWRVGGTLAIFAAVWGILAAVRTLRAEEEAGRSELVLAGVVGRDTLFRSAIGATAVGAVVLWVACFAGLVVAGLPAGGSAYLALAVISSLPVSVGIGALASQLAPTRRMALELAGAVVAAWFVLRVVADRSGSLSWLRWLTPLGWAEELRPFGGARPAVLVLPVLVTALLLAAAGLIWRRRDVGAALLAARDRAAPRLRLLSSPTAFALRSERVSLSVWLGSVGAFAFIIGVISNSISAAGISKSLEQQLEKLGAGSILTPKGYLGFTFIFFVLVISLFACSQIGAARHEESDQQLETLLALPVSRRSWLGGRLALAVAGAVAIALVAGLMAWAGAASQGVNVSAATMLGAGANCLPASLLFLGLAALAYAVVPRASAALSYGLVVVAFLWQLFGSLFGAPRWLVDVTPFEHVGLVPATAFRPAAAIVMLVIGGVAAVLAVAVFERRDLLGA